MSYPFLEIEKKWQDYWEKNNSFATPDTSQAKNKPKYYVLDMFPYPSGAGLHVGHPEGYTATDIIARYKRMCGYNVLHPMGWDAFGLPAERYASVSGIPPAITTKKNIETFRRQLKSLGFSYDWGREINTTDPNYYKWTQWIFLKMFNSYYDEKEDKALPISELKIPSHISKDEKLKNTYINSKRLAYLKDAPVNYCPELGSILANEEVEEWTSKGYTVERKLMRQWLLRITLYAKRLIEDLQFVDWPLGTLLLQKNWIGESKGSFIHFQISPLPLKNKAKEITIFTTRPDTIFGVTYIVLAPEHPLVSIITSSEKKEEVDEYVKKASRISEVERMIQNKDKKKTGVFTGGYVKHPFTQEKIPVWIADYILMGYGTGAVMAVPAHDERDLEFANVFKLPIKKIMSDDGILFASDFLDGLKQEEAVLRISKEIEERKLGSNQIIYKLRDWLFSRQRYWGEPIPISHDKEGNYHTESEDALPLMLPQIADYQPSSSGESPLARASSWVEHDNLSTGLRLQRETNTMPQWAGSCWYYLRFLSPNYTTSLVDPEAEKYWMQGGGVDLYIGGAEHAVLHLLYARFWHKFLYDIGLVSTIEPFKKLIHQGLILGEDGQKMSKSRGNVVNPDQVVLEYGADTLRLYEMFLGPLEKSKPWSARGIEGVSRFLLKVWRLYTNFDVVSKQDSPNHKTTETTHPYNIDSKLIEEASSEARKEELDFLLHSTIKKVTEDIEIFSFNTAISSLMIYVNEVSQSKQIGGLAARQFLLLLAPFAPHIAEELWFLLGNINSLTYESWPKYEESKTLKKIVEVVFQVNSKVRSKKKLGVGLSKETLEKLALEDTNVQKFIEGKKVQRILTIPDKLVNIVCS